MEAYALTDTGCVRTNNEDYWLVKPELGLYVVADGMGGAKAGERASRLAADTVAETVTAAPRRDAQVLIAAVEEANRKVMTAAGSDPNMEGMGTTLVAALETSEGISIASVGDSRAYILEDGYLRMITQDQTWINDVGRPLGLDEEALRTHPMRHVLTMAIGVSPELRVHTYTVRPQPGELILLSSDGLHGVLEPGVIAEKLAGNGSLEAKCRRLIDAARQAGGPDNITVVLLHSK